MKKSISSLLTVLLLLLLGGCAASQDTQSAAAYMPEAYTMNEADMAYDEQTGEETLLAEAKTGAGSAVQKLSLPQGRKIILTAYLEMESTQYDKSYEEVLTAAQRQGGYISASSHTAGVRRRCEITLRIPADNYQAFMTALSDAGSVLSKEESSEDVTGEYVDVQARIKALETQEASLLSLMEKAESLEDILMLEDRLSTIRYEIESYTARQKTYDDLTNYSTVHLTLQEVTQARTLEEPTFGQRIAAAFSDCWEGVKSWAQNTVVALVYLLPWLAGLLLTGGIVTVVVCRIRKKRKNKGGRAQPLIQEPKQPDLDDEPDVQQKPL